MKSFTFNPGMVISSFSVTGTFTIPPFSLLLFTPVTCSSGSWGQWEQFPEDKGEVGVQQAVPRLSQAQHVDIWDFPCSCWVCLRSLLYECQGVLPAPHAPNLLPILHILCMQAFVIYLYSPWTMAPLLRSDFKSSVCLLCWHFWKPL